LFRETPSDFIGEQKKKARRTKKSKAPALPFPDGLDCPQLHSLPKPGITPAFLNKTLSTNTSPVDKKLYEFSNFQLFFVTIIPKNHPSRRKSGIHGRKNNIAFILQHHIYPSVSAAQPAWNSKVGASGHR
jgi:hypothetical protein